MAKLGPEFVKRGGKVIGLSVDSTTDHEAWADDIEETQGSRPNYPIIGDADFNVSKLYGMPPASTSGDPKSRTPADNQTVRNVFVIGPDNKVKLILVYPMTTCRNFDEVARDRLETSPSDVATLDGHSDFARAVPTPDHTSCRCCTSPGWPKTNRSTSWSTVTRPARSRWLPIPWG